jgi:D-alanine-D-alanine ligase-like ATP-grasp enzyme
VLGDQALPIIEIVAKEGFYDFAEKYPFLNPNAAPGGGARHFCPAPIPEDQTRAIQEFAYAPFARSTCRSTASRCHAAGKRRLHGAGDQHDPRA